MLHIKIYPGRRQLPMGKENIHLFMLLLGHEIKFFESTYIHTNKRDMNEGVTTDVRSMYYTPKSCRSSRYLRHNIL